MNTMVLCLRWPNTVFARALADAIQRAHKDCENKHAVDTAIISALSLLFFFVIERSVLMALVLYNKCMLRKGNNAKNPAIFGFFQIERTQLNATHAH